MEGKFFGKVKVFGEEKRRASVIWGFKVLGGRMGKKKKTTHLRFYPCYGNYSFYYQMDGMLKNHFLKFGVKNGIN